MLFDDDDDNDDENNDYKNDDCNNHNYDGSKAIDSHDSDDKTS